MSDATKGALTRPGGEASRGRRPTSYDVARLAGVSQSAVSRCFKPGASISEETRARVLEAAQRLDYQPNAIARGLITRRSDLVAVLIASRVNQYYPEVLLLLTQKLAAHELRLLLFTVDSEADAQRVLDQVGRYQVDGLISISHLSVEQHEALRRRGIAVVLFNRAFAAHPCASVTCDPTHQARALIRRLVDLGHRRFGVIDGPASNMVSRERMRIVREALAAHDLAPTAEALGDFTYDSGAAALRLIVNQDPTVTAIVSINDMMALGCLDAARQALGLETPQDLSVVSFDGTAVGQFAGYRLTTIRQPIEQMAEAACGLLQAQIANPESPLERRLFEGALIDGATIGPPRRRERIGPAAEASLSAREGRGGRRRREPGQS